MSDLLRCMSLRQPWASLTVPPAGVTLADRKDVENRHKTPPPRWMREEWAAGRQTWIAIHASQGSDPVADWEAGLLRAGAAMSVAAARKHWPRGAVIGWVRVVGVLDRREWIRSELFDRGVRVLHGEAWPGDYPWWQARCYGWILAEPWPIEPIPCPGQQSVLWRPHGDLRAALLRSAESLGIPL